MRVTDEEDKDDVVRIARELDDLDIDVTLPSTPLHTHTHPS